MATEAFDSEYYLRKKLEALQTDPETAQAWASKTQGDLEQALEAAGLTAAQHYEAYGFNEAIYDTDGNEVERLTPNRFFDLEEYRAAKAQQLIDEGDTEFSSLSLAAAEAKFERIWNEVGSGNLYDHYLQYGESEGVNPSNDFDLGAYYSSKLAALQDDPDPEISETWRNADVEQLKDVFAGFGLSAIEHYAAFGQTEGLEAEPVSPADQPSQALTIDEASAAQAKGTLPARYDIRDTAQSLVTYSNSERDGGNALDGASRVVVTRPDVFETLDLSGLSGDYPVVTEFTETPANLTSFVGRESGNDTIVANGRVDIRGVALNEIDALSPTQDNRFIVSATQARELVDAISDRGDDEVAFQIRGEGGLSVQYAGDDYNAQDDASLSGADIELLLADINFLVLYDKLGPTEAVSIPDDRLLSVAAADLLKTDWSGEGKIEVRLFEGTETFPNVDTLGLDLSEVAPELTLTAVVTGAAAGGTIDMRSFDASSTQGFQRLEDVTFIEGFGDGAILTGDVDLFTGTSIRAGNAADVGVRVTGVDSQSVRTFDPRQFELGETGTLTLDVGRETDVLLPAQTGADKATAGRVVVEGDRLEKVRFRAEDSENAPITSEVDLSRFAVNANDDFQQVQLYVDSGASVTAPDAFSIFSVNGSLTSGDALIGGDSGYSLLVGENPRNLSSSLDDTSADVSQAKLSDGIISVFLEGSGTSLYMSGNQADGQSFNVIGGDDAAQTLSIEIAEDSSTAPIDLSGLTFNAITSEGQSFAWQTDGTDVVRVNGSAGADTIIGTDSADTINGSAGGDQMTGGAGADTFQVAPDEGGGDIELISSGPDGAGTYAIRESPDVVTDFTFGEDILALLSDEITSSSLSSLGDFQAAGETDVDMSFGTYDNSGDVSTWFSNAATDSLNNAELGANKADARDIVLYADDPDNDSDSSSWIILSAPRDANGNYLSLADEVVL